MHEPSPHPVLGVRPAGPRAWLLEVPERWATAVAARLRSDAESGLLGRIVDVVGGAESVLVVHEGADLRAVLAAAAHAGPETAATSRHLEIEVVFDGADLAEVATRCGLTSDAVVDLHTSAVYTVAFCGFLPGFAYLTGLPAALHLPRRSTPRASVPAGSLAVAGPYTGVYPTASPGGWHLLGRVDAVMWDETRAAPALLGPGDTVRWIAR